MNGDILVPLGQCVSLLLFTSGTALWVVFVVVIVPVSIGKCMMSSIREVRRSRGECARCGYPLLSGSACSECGASPDSARMWTPRRRTLLLAIGVTIAASVVAGAMAEAIMRGDERRFMAEFAESPTGNWIQQECLIGSDLIRRADGIFGRDN
jgi:hypothetical protein